MPDSPKPPAIGEIGWLDLTVPNADAVGDFYRHVAGWTASPVDMGGYNDYMMATPEGKVVAGVCHARGSNAALPPAWLVYIVVKDLDESLRQCAALGGKIRGEIRSYGDQGRYCVIEDPAGAVAALFEPPSKS